MLCKFLLYIISRPVWIFILFIQLFFHTPVHTQVSSFYFRHLTSANGLSDGFVRDIVQDKYGFIWIGTSYGLNRFDGITVKTFFSKTSDSGSVSNNLIQTLYADKQGDIWIGTREGLCRFDYSTNRFIRYNTPTPISIIDIIQDGTGKIWVGTDHGFMIVDDKKFSLQKLTVPGNATEQKKFVFAIRQIIASSDSTWYIATQQGIRIFNPLSSGLSEIRHDPLNKSSLSSDNVYSLSIDPNGYLWAACGYNGSVMERIDLKKNTIKHYTHFTNSAKKWSNNTIQRVMTGRKGRIWVISSYSGVSVYNEKKDDFEDYASDPLIPNSLLANTNVAIFEDREGVIWLGTTGYGLSYFNPEKNFFNTIYPASGINNQVAETWARSVCEDKQGNLWLGTGRGLIKYDPVNRLFGTSLVNTDDKKPVIHYNSIRALLEDDNGDIWIGTAQGLNRYHPSTGVIDFFTANQGMPLAFFWMIMKDKNGTIWLGSAWGLYRYDRKKNIFDNLSKDSILKKCVYKNIQSLYVDSHNRLWIGMLDIGLMMYDIETKEHRLLTIKDSLISDTRFSSFAEDQDGIIWIGAENRLTAYDPVNNCSKFYSRENGLSSDRTNNIMVDSMNRVWVGTSNGLCLLNAKRDKIKRFDINDGLLTNQFNEQAACRTRNGLFVFTTYKGFLVFKPEAYKENDSAVPVYVTSFKISGKEIDQPTENLQDIHLKPDQNFFNIELAGLNYMNPYQCMYAYRLDPFDKDWIFTSKREINYTKVPAGDYTFRYKVITGDADLSVPEKIITISIDEVFYRTTLFKAFILLIIIAIVVAFFRYRLQQREKILVLKNKAQMLEKEKAVVQFENLKQQLNPHFLFNSLTSLRSLIRVDTKTAVNFLDGLSKTYRYLLKSDDSELVPLEEELNFVQTFVELQKTRFKEGIQVSVNVDASCHAKYIVPVTVQNLIENAIKHNTTAADQPLFIDIYNENNYIVIRNNLQRYRVVETSNKRGLASMKNLYGYLTGKPVIIEEDEKYFTVKIPLI